MGVEERDRILASAGVRIPEWRRASETVPRYTARARRRYGFFWAKRCEDVEDDLHRARGGCVPAFCGLITPWFTAGVIRSVPDPCRDWNAAEEDAE